MKKIIITFLLAIIGVYPISTLAQNQTKDFNSLTKEERIADLKYFTNQILTTHPAPYEITKQSEWEQQVKKLENGIENLDVSGFFFRLQEAAALVDDIHTSVFPIDNLGLLTTTYPIRFRWMNNGIFVRASDKTNYELIGTKLITVQDVAIEDIIKEIIKFAPGNSKRQDSNVILAYLLCPDTYRYLGLLSDDNFIKLEVIDAEGKQKKVILKPETVSLMSAYNSNTVTGWAVPPGWSSILNIKKNKIPIFYKRRDEMAWFQPLSEKNALLVQINQPKPDDNNTMLNFISSLFDHLINNKYERIILDLRGNEGGWFILTNSLAGLFSTFLEPKLYLLIGSETASAGVVLATQIEKQTNAIFIGEGTGSSPNFYGSYKVETLPNSGFYYRISTMQYVISMPQDDRIRLWPDVAVVERVEDILIGRDSAMEKALSLRLDEFDNAQYSWYGRWMRPSQKH